MHCNDVLFVKFSECKDSFTFPISLTPNTDYAYLLTDKFGNKYKNTFTSNSDGLLTINKSDFQDFTFTSASGNFTLSIKEHMNSCNNINFVYCDAEFESITFSFSKNHLNLMPTCEIIRTCLGISDAGNESSFLNEKGEFKTYQEILSNLPSYATQQDAIDDGNPNGFWYYNTTSKTITKIGVEITSYTAGTSTIDFTNNGGDDWTVGFKIAVSDLPSGWSVVNYHYNVTLLQGGVVRRIENGAKIADYDVTSNLSGNGAGVYSLSCIYTMTDGINNSSIIIGGLIKVDNAGNVLGGIYNYGFTVNSVNELSVSYTAHITQYIVSETVNVASIDKDTDTPTILSNSLTDTITLLPNSGGIRVFTNLDPIFWSDLGYLLSNPSQVGSFYSTTIS